MPWWSALAVALTATALLGPVGSAEGAVTIGSSLASAANETGPCGAAPCTVANRNLAATLTAPGGLTSPVNGTLTSWSFRAQAGGYTLTLESCDHRGTSTPGRGQHARDVDGRRSGSDRDVPDQSGDHIGLDASTGAFILSDVGAPNLALSCRSRPGGWRCQGRRGVQPRVLVQAVVDPPHAPAGKWSGTEGDRDARRQRPQRRAARLSGAGVKVVGPAAVAASGEIKLKIKAAGRRRPS
jgi:hypothetical protein